MTVPVLSEAETFAEIHGVAGPVLASECLHEGGAYRD
jgi:hypothetical protein